MRFWLGIPQAPLQIHVRAMHITFPSKKLTGHPIYNETLGLNLRMRVKK